MADPYVLQSLSIAGFRAYLQPKTFDFSRKRCLAIFAPNGSGKSSVIDALEFMLSKDGTLERLGQRAINNQAGPVALAHNLAEEAGIAPAVTVSLVSGEVTADGSRSATETKRRLIPEVAKTLNACFVAPPIIRGHTLRTFVEIHTPEQRYADVANWLQLSPLVKVQGNVRALRRQVRAAVDDKTALRNLNTRLAKETAQVVKAWDPAEVLAYANRAVLAPLDPTLVFAALAAGDPAYLELEARAKAEENKIGIAGLRQIRKTAAALWVEVTDAASGEAIIGGVIPTFDAAVATLSAAESKESEERGKAASTVFQALWKAAEPLFAEGVLAPDVCPVCATPVLDTAAGSTEMIREHIAKRLEELADYAAAKKALDEARAESRKAHTHLAAALPALINLLGDGDAALRTDLIAYQAGIAGWPRSAVSASADIVAAIAKLLATLDQAIIDIESKQGDHTYVKAKAKIDRLLELRDEHDLGLRTRRELEKLSDALTAQAATVSGEIRKKVQALLDKLQMPMNAIYRQIQGASATPIRLELPQDGDANQQRLNLLRACPKSC